MNCTKKLFNTCCFVCVRPRGTVTLDTPEPEKKSVDEKSVGLLSKFVSTSKRQRPPPQPRIVGRL